MRRNLTNPIAENVNTGGLKHDRRRKERRAKACKQFKGGTMTAIGTMTVINAGAIGYCSSRVAPRPAVAVPLQVTSLAPSSRSAPCLVSAFAPGIRGATPPPTG